MPKLHPTIRDAGRESVLPTWASASPGRLRHSERVGRLLWKWGAALDLSKRDRVRWRAAGLLHDALKDADPTGLRAGLPEAGEWPDPLLHGPACAERLRSEGVEDEGLLRAIACHTTGHPEFDLLGEALYLADYLEPGRRRMAKRRAAWRKRMPREWDAVLVEVAASKIGTLLDRRLPLPELTKGFWNALLDRGPRNGPPA